MGILEKVYRNTGTDASEKCAFGNKEICWMDSSAGRQRYRFAPVRDRKHCRVKKT
jgi:hypothetical protein